MGFGQAMLPETPKEYYMPCNNQLDLRYNAKQAHNDLDEAIVKAAKENREQREQFARSKWHR